MAAPVHTRRILVPLDGSDLATIAIPWARALATPETEVVLFRAVPELAPMTELAGAREYPATRVFAHRLRDADDYLADVKTALHGVLPHVATATGAGEAPDTILDAAEAQGVDLIVMATHGRGFTGRVVIGSVADRVARASTVPVLLVHPARGAGAAHVDDPVRVSRIVVPLDGSERARGALSIAEALARQIAAPIHLIRALPTAEEIASQRDSHDDMYYAEQAAAITDALAEEAHKLSSGGLTVTGETVVGEPGQSIIGATRKDDLIVMTSHGTGGVRRWLLGSVAERLLRSGAAPVLLVPVPERRRLVEAAR